MLGVEAADLIADTIEGMKQVADQIGLAGSSDLSAAATAVP